MLILFIYNSNQVKSFNRVYWNVSGKNCVVIYFAMWITIDELWININGKVALNEFNFYLF